MPLRKPLGVADVESGSVDLRRRLPGAPADLWQALTDPSRTSAWLGELIGGPLGAQSRFELWHDRAVRSHHVVQRWNPVRLLQITWEFPQETPSLVTFQLQAGTPPSTDGVDLRLEHVDLDDPPSYAAGWHRHLDHLHAHLSGDDLPLANFWDGYDQLLELYRASPGQQ